MKKVKIQILVVVILLGKGVSLYGMFSALRGRATTIRQAGMSPRATAARLAVVGQQKTLSSQQRVVESKPDTSTWSGWAQSKLNQFKSLFKRSQPQQQVRSVVPNVGPRTSGTSPFGRGGQRRSYSTVVINNAAMSNAVSLEQSAVKQESNDIINKLNSANPDWGFMIHTDGGVSHSIDEDTLYSKIREFFTENSAADIKDVFIHLTRSSKGYSLLSLLTGMNNKGAEGKGESKRFPKKFEWISYWNLSGLGKKLIPLVEEFFDHLDPVFINNFVVAKLDKSEMGILDSLKKRALNRLVLNKNLFLEKVFDKDRWMEKILPSDSKNRAEMSDIILSTLNEFFNKDNTIASSIEQKDRLINILMILRRPLKNFKHIGDFIKNNKADCLKSDGGITCLAQVLQPEEFLKEILDIDNEFKGTSSYKHLKMFCTYYFTRDGSKNELIRDLEDLFYDITDNLSLKGVIKASLKKEKELQDNGYEVFYHGRRWQYGFLSDIYSMLYEFKSGKKLNDFIFTHLDDPVIGKVSEKFFESEQKKRERLAKEGNPLSHKTKHLPENAPRETEEQKEAIIKAGTGFANRQTLLFLNKFLFGNLGKLGSNSMYYVLSNWNVGEIAFSIQEIFSMFGYSDIYKAHEQELLALQKKYEALSQYGELLQIAVPKKNLDKCIYYTTSGGPKLPFKTSEGTTTTDIKDIVKDLDKNSQDITEFVLINTSDKFGGLNPDSGIKIFSYNLVEPEKMTAFKDELVEALAQKTFPIEEEKSEFDKIEKDLQEKSTQEVENQ